jgi:hypothetical protein
MIYLISFILFLIANFIFVKISYDDVLRLHEYKGFLFGYMGSIISMSGWYLLIKNVKYDNIFFVDLIWEIGATLISVVLPLFLFNIQVNTTMWIGIFVCFFGMIIVKIGELYR